MRKKLMLFCTTILVLMLVVSGCAAKKSSSKNNSVKTETKKSQPKKKAASVQSTSMLNELKNSKQKNLVYYALGDSLSVGLFSNEMNTRFTTLFKNDLQKGTDKKVTEVNNSSVGKTVTNFGLPNVQDLIDQQPDIVTIEFGTNDAAYGVDPKNLGDFTNNLDTLINRVKNETHAKILLLTTWSPSDGKYLENDATYDQKIKDIGNKYGVTVVDLSTIWRGNPQVTKNDLRYSQTYNRQKDQFHPNQIGHAAIAKLLYETVKTK